MFPPTPPFSVSLFLRSFTTSPSASLPKPPNLSLLADKCLSMRQLKQVHAQMVVSARTNDNYAASRLLYFSAVSEFGDLSYAAKLFNHTREPNTFMWNVMIWAQSKSPNPLGALSLYVRMARIGIRPGKHTLPFVLKACSCIGSIDCCRQVHAQVLMTGFDRDSHVVDGLLRCYFASGGLKEARQLFDETSEKDLSIWTSMICGYALKHCSDEAMVLLEQIIGTRIVPPIGATLTSVLSICAQNGCTELGDRIHKFVKKKQIELGVVLGTALVHMYASSGAISKARSVFDSMPEKNIRTWNAVIHGLAVYGQAKEAVNLFRQLKNEQHLIRPNEVTFLGLLSACCHAGLLEEGHEIFHSMTSVYNIEPKIEHYGCMVDLLGRRGRLLEAENLIRMIKHKTDVALWGALLTACRNLGNIEVAERAADEILALDPENHGAHVALSNMYADAGRWEDVSRLRKAMKKGELIKVPGWTLVNDDS